jgi:hypothetical protein
MANEDPMKRSRPGGARDDEFRVDLDWGDLSEEPSPPSAVPAADGSGRPAETETGATIDERLDEIEEVLRALRAEVAELRADVAELPRQPSAAPGGPSDDVLAQLMAMHEEIQTVKRRLSLRASGPTERTADEAELVARLVAERLAGLERPPSSPG